MAHSHAGLTLGFEHWRVNWCLFSWHKPPRCSPGRTAIGSNDCSPDAERCFLDGEPYCLRGGGGGAAGLTVEDDPLNEPRVLTKSERTGDL
jgi:hypothetical protein